MAAKSPRTLSRWGLVSLNGNGPHLAGYEVGQGTRTSTPLVEFDSELGTALTASGRPYKLHGDGNPRYGYLVAREVWGQYFDLTGSAICGLTVEEAVNMIIANGNRAYDRTIEDENALRRKYGMPEVVDESDVTQVSDVISDLIIPDPEDGEDDEPGRRP